MLFRTIKNNLSFFFPYSLVLVALIPVLLINSKPELHLLINGYHNDFFDVFFKCITWIGDGIFIFVPVTILLFFSVRHVVFVVSAYLSTGLITQLLKRIFFNDVIRPSRLFADEAQLHLVEGVRMLAGRSFPSGHATSAFAICLSLALIVRNNTMKFIFFIIACLVAFSRVYLSQHFLIDVYVGSVIGITGALVFYAVYYRNSRQWHSWNILNIFHKR